MMLTKQVTLVHTETHVIHVWQGLPDSALDVAVEVALPRPLVATLLDCV